MVLSCQKNGAIKITETYNRQKCKEKRARGKRRYTVDGKFK